MRITLPSIVVIGPLLCGCLREDPDFLGPAGAESSGAGTDAGDAGDDGDAGDSADGDDGSAEGTSASDGGDATAGDGTASGGSTGGTDGGGSEGASTDSTSSSDGGDTSDTGSTGAGTTGSPCDPGLSPCDGECVDLQIDPRNCGECGMRCHPSMEVCEMGVCVPG